MDGVYLTQYIFIIALFFLARQAYWQNLAVKLSSRWGSLQTGRNFRVERVATFPQNTHLGRRTRGGTLDDYLKRHPEARRNGRVHCHNCGGNSLHVLGIGRTFWARDLINAHIC